MEEFLTAIESEELSERGLDQSGLLHKKAKNEPD